MNRDTLKLTITPLPDARPDGPDQWQKWRMILKRLLRSYGWRCVRIEPVRGPDDPPTGDS